MEQALRRLIDRQEIADLIHDYCIHVDRYEPEKVAALFTEDCITDYGAAFGGAVVGRRRVERGCGYTLAGWQATSHHVSNIRLWFDDADHAHGLTYLHAWHRVDDETPTFQVFARYNDRFVRTDEGWRFSERRVTAAGQEGGQNEFEGIGRRTPDPALVEKVRSRA
jgi:hypothetical protein